MKSPDNKIHLTKREFQVLNLMAKGLNNNSIAYNISITSHTVKSHVASILKKLKAKYRSLAVIIGIKKGVLTIKEINV